MGSMERSIAEIRSVIQTKEVSDMHYKNAKEAQVLRLRRILETQANALPDDQRFSVFLSQNIYNEKIFTEKYDPLTNRLLRAVKKIRSAEEDEEIYDFSYEDEAWFFYANKISEEMGKRSEASNTKP